MNERIKDFFKYADNSGMVDIFRCRHYITRPDKINSLEQCKQADKATVNEIDDLKRLIDFLQEYRIELFNRYQEIVSTNYRLRLTLKREINYYKNKKFITYILKKSMIVKTLSLKNFYKNVLTEQNAIKRLSGLPNCKSNIQI